MPPITIHVDDDHYVIADLSDSVSTYAVMQPITSPIEHLELAEKYLMMNQNQSSWSAVLEIRAARTLLLAALADARSSSDVVWAP